MTKTREELEALKQQWLANPDWDIEDTPGFEEYFTELRAFRSEKQSEWNDQYRRQCLRRAELAGRPGELELGALLLKFERSSEFHTSKAAECLERALRSVGLDPDVDEIRGMLDNLVAAAGDRAKADMVTELAREL